MSQETTVVLRTYNDIVEASIDQDKLKENGIRSFMEDENPVGLNPLGGIELKVFMKDKAAAEKLIAVD